MRLSRADESRMSAWWFTVDHVLLTAIMILAAVGLFVSLAASPEVALKKGLATFYFFERHIFFSCLGLLTMVLISTWSTKTVRRAALVLFLLGLWSMIWIALFGVEVNGARRWLFLAGQSLQPSEFIKPAFVVLVAWLFAEARTQSEMPAFTMAIAVLLLVGGLLIVQPDIGQTMLIGAVWGGIYVLAGLPIVGAGLLFGVAAVGLVAAYLTLAHVKARIDAFFDPQGFGNTQLDRAAQSFVEGGFFGRGPGEGTIKSILPDAHTDFIFAVIAEEYGVVACFALLALFAFITFRAMRHAGRQPDMATRLSIQGLALMFGLQALINMGVNVGLLPAKGMTLPFISAGGSSLLAVCILLGMLLAFTRRQPGDRQLSSIRDLDHRLSSHPN